MRAPNTRDRGLSLIELMVAMTIILVVGGIATGGIIEMLRSSTQTRTRLANLDQVRQGMDAMSKSIRTAVRPEQLNPSCVTYCGAAFEKAVDGQVVFTANLGDSDSAGKPAPTRIIYTVAPGAPDTVSITETRQHVATSWTSGDYTWAGGTVLAPCAVGGPHVAGCQARVITTAMSVPAPTKPVFVYRNLAQAVLVTSPAITGTALTTITAVDLALPVGDADHASPSVTSSVFLPNSTLGR